MKKIFWVRIKKWDGDLVAAALEAGADALVFDEAGMSAKAKELGLIQTVAPDGDLKIGEEVREFSITSKEVENEVVASGDSTFKIITNVDWTIIPLENLISKTKNIIQTVENAEQAKLALTTMEVGTDGICLDTDSPAEIAAVGKIVRDSNNEKLELVTAVVESTEPVGVADRVCLDTTAILEPGQGVLVGDSSSGMFLAFNENVESPYCDPRPFRVNAGAVHAYIRLPNDRTGYLSEVRSGSQILIVDPGGNTFPLAVGRAKIEKRPMLIVRAKVGDKPISLVMQNAETIRLTRPDGSPVSITKLKKGDEVLAFVELAGRHFGTKVEETINEK